AGGLVLCAAAQLTVASADHRHGCLSRMFAIELVVVSRVSAEGRCCRCRGEHSREHFIHTWNGRPYRRQSPNAAELSSIFRQRIPGHQSLPILTPWQRFQALEPRADCRVIFRDIKAELFGW